MHSQAVPYAEAPTPIAVPIQYSIAVICGNAEAPAPIAVFYSSTPKRRRLCVVRSAYA